MVRVIRNVEQTLCRGLYSALEVTEMDVGDSFVDASFLPSLDLHDDNSRVGVACSQNAKGVVTHLAFSTSSTNVLCICLSGTGPKAKAATVDAQRRSQTHRILERIFLHSKQKKFAFDMHKLALALFFDYGLTVTQAVDLQSSRPDNRRSVATLIALLGDEVNRGAVLDAFQGSSFVAGGIENLALRAWAARRAALCLSSAELQSVSSIDTSDIPAEVSIPLSCHTAP